MFALQSYENIKNQRKKFIMLNMIAILFISGMTFTFVIPSMKYFSFLQFSVSIIMYYFIANIYNGLYKKKPFIVFISVLFLSSLGILWRVILEWGEESLSTYMKPVILFSYPFSIALFVTIIYILVTVRLEKQQKLVKTIL